MDAKKKKRDETYLMPNYEDVFLPLKFHDHGFQPHDHVAVRLAAAVPVVELVFVAVGKVVWVGALQGYK